MEFRWTPRSRGTAGFIPCDAAPPRSAASRRTTSLLVEPVELDTLQLRGVAAFGEVNWVHNLRAAREAVVTRGRQEVEVDAIEVAPEEGGPVLRDALAPYLKSRLLSIVLRRFFNFRSDSTLAEYVAEAGRHPMFELRTRIAAKTAG